VPLMDSVAGLREHLGAEVATPRQRACSWAAGLAMSRRRKRPKAAPSGREACRPQERDAWG
jgi:hypothetical protein